MNPQPLPPRIRRIRRLLEAQGLTVIRLPGNCPTWVVLSQQPPATFSCTKNGRYQATSIALQDTLDKVTA